MRGRKRGRRGQYRRLGEGGQRGKREMEVSVKVDGDFTV